MYVGPELPRVFDSSLKTFTAFIAWVTLSREAFDLYGGVGRNDGNGAAWALGEGAMLAGISCCINRFCSTRLASCCVTPEFLVFWGSSDFWYLHGRSVVQYLQRGSVEAE